MSFEPHLIYQSMMLEIKIRIRTIDNSLSETGSNRQLSSFDADLCFLQVRKIVEQICFSSILCDQNRYKEFRKLEGDTDDSDAGKYEQDWNSRIILNRLKDISPHFMPIPLGERKSDNGVHHFERSESELNVTHNKLIRIYKKCGGYMHVAKPFGEGYLEYNKKQIQKYEVASEILLRYVEYFKSLLWNHVAIGIDFSEGDDPLEPASPKNAWIVDFGEYGSNDITIIVGVGN